MNDDATMKLSINGAAREAAAADGAVLLLFGDRHGDGFEIDLWRRS